MNFHSHKVVRGGGVVKRGECGMEGGAEKEPKRRGRIR